MMLPPEGLGVGRGSASSTQALIGDYSSSFQGLNGGNTGLRAPLRTPLQENIIMQEARNQRAFRDMTPLAGKMLYLSPSSSLSHGTNYMKHVVQHQCTAFHFSPSLILRLSFFRFFMVMPPSSLFFLDSVYPFVSSFLFLLFSPSVLPSNLQERICQNCMKALDSRLVVLGPLQVFSFYSEHIEACPLISY